MERRENGGGLFRPAAALMDMDGLMLDTERPAVRIWVEVSSEAGHPIDEAVPLSTVGLDERDTRARVMEACGPAYPYDEIRTRVEERYRAFMESPGPAHRPGLLALLDRFGQLGVPVAVATSTPRKAALAKLERAGILGRFGALACGDEVERGKPAPDIFRLAAGRLGVEPADCVGFEDSPAGLRALASAGVRSVFVKDCVEPDAGLLAGVWRRCGDLAEAARLFG